MTASTTQVILTAVGVLAVTIIPFLWGLSRLIRHVSEHDVDSDEQVV